MGLVKSKMLRLSKLEGILKMVSSNIIKAILLLFVTSLFPCLPAQDKLPLFHSLEEAHPDKEMPVLLIFFSTRCHVCWEDLFEMKYFLESNNLKIGLVAVSYDREDELIRFMKKYSFYYPVICDLNKKIYRRFGVQDEPFWIISVGDKVLYRYNYFMTNEQRKAELKKCLTKIGIK